MPRSPLTHLHLWASGLLLAAALACTGRAPSVSTSSPASAVSPIPMPEDCPDLGSWSPGERTATLGNFVTALRSSDAHTRACATIGTKRAVRGAGLDDAGFRQAVEEQLIPAVAAVLVDGRMPEGALHRGANFFAYLDKRLTREPVERRLARMHQRASTVEGQFYTLAALSQLPMESAESVETVCTTTRNAKGKVAQMAVQALRELRRDRDTDCVIPALTGALANRETDVQALVGLGVRGKAARGAPVDAILPLLANPGEGSVPGRHGDAPRSFVVPHFGANALGQIGDDRPEVVAALTELLGHEHRAVQGAAAFALGQLGPAARAALPKLIELRDAPHRQDDHYERTAHEGAVFAIEKIRGR